MPQPNDKLKQKMEVQRLRVIEGGGSHVIDDELPAYNRAERRKIAAKLKKQRASRRKGKATSNVPA
jgi:hypothetical protein